MLHKIVISARAIPQNSLPSPTAQRIGEASFIALLQCSCPLDGMLPCHGIGYLSHNKQSSCQGTAKYKGPFLDNSFVTIYSTQIGH